MDYKVLITTSGIGSRLGDFTKYTNKTLVRISEKPVISYIIESYPTNTKFVVTLGYYGEFVKDFLEIAYPHHFFEFVWVDNFQEVGSSLLYSMVCAKDNLQLPFIFHACDTIVTEKIPEPNINWNAGFKGGSSSQYTSFDMIEGNVKIFYDKGNINPDFLHIGLVGIYNYKSFWDLAVNFLIENNYKSTCNDVEVLKKMILTEDIKIIEFKSWLDIGNIEKLEETKKFFNNPNFNVLDKTNESIYNIDGNIIKFFYDQTIAQNRVLRTKFLKNAVPNILDAKNNFYKYQYVQGELFSNIANRNNFLSLLTWANKNLWHPIQDFNALEFKKNVYNFYIEKTQQRINQFFLTRNVIDKEDIINGEKIPTIKALLEQVDSDYLCNTQPSSFHGDFILDNIIYQGNNDFKLIDWRQDFGGQIEAGDMYYDLAKMSHNLVVNHHLIEQNHFEVIIKKNEIKLNILRYQTLVDCEELFYQYLLKNKFDIKKVKLLRAIIWLNMSPLHHHPFDLFLFYFGKYNLYNTLNEYKNEA